MMLARSVDMPALEQQQVWHTSEATAWSSSHTLHMPLIFARSPCTATCRPHIVGDTHSMRDMPTLCETTALLTA